MAPPKRKSTQWVAICDKRLWSSEQADGGAKIISLPSPKTGVLSRYMVSADGSELLGLKKHTPGDRSSFFIGDSVQSDGAVYIASRVDPVFLVLPALQAIAGNSKFMTLDQVVATASECPGFHHILACRGLDGLKQICDYQEIGDITAYRLNEDKLYAWLQAKTVRVAEALLANSVHVQAGSVSASLVPAATGSYTGVFPDQAIGCLLDDHVRYALGLMGDHLTPETLAKLATRMNVDVQQPLQPKPAAVNAGPAPVKRASDGPAEDYTKYNKKAAPEKPKGKMTVGQKKLAAVNTSGMKKISSFFGSK